MEEKHFWYNKINNLFWANKLIVLLKDINWYESIDNVGYQYSSEDLIDNITDYWTDEADPEIQVEECLLELLATIILCLAFEKTDAVQTIKEYLMDEYWFTAEELKNLIEFYSKQNSQIISDTFNKYQEQKKKLENRR